MFGRNTIALAAVVALVLLNSGICQDIGYPETPEIEQRRQNALNRTPLFIPGRCSDNELLFPGDQANDWICDCAPAHLYHPATSRCHPAFRQGPCSAGQILILENREVIPKCIRNACRENGLVSYQKRCYTLGEPGPCPRPDMSYALAVNSTTMELGCIPQSVIFRNRLGESDEVNDLSVTSPEILSRLNFKAIPLCANGTKRAIDGVCPTTFKYTIFEP